MNPQAFHLLERKRRGAALSAEEIGAVVDGAARGTWGDAELAAFLMAAAIRGLDAAETRALTLAMLDSGERWELAREVPRLGDKHSTGGVGDKVSLILGPLLAACDRPVVMLTGRGLGHTGGTADKLEAIPGLALGLDRAACLASLRRCGLAIGVATAAIAPADRRLYALRDRTATIDCLPLITASILSKKLATGAAAMVFDVKTGDGAFLEHRATAEELARLLVATVRSLGGAARALVTDMSQPLGRWVGHAAEVAEALDCLAGDGARDLVEVTLALAGELAEMTGDAIPRQQLAAALADGRGRERFLAWAETQGASRAWLRRPELELAPHEVVVPAPHGGVLAAVATRKIGELLVAAGAGRSAPEGRIDHGVALRVERKLGDRVEAGEELARLYLRRRDPALEAAVGGCFRLAQEGAAPPLVVERIAE